MDQQAQIDARLAQTILVPSVTVPDDALKIKGPDFNVRNKNNTQ